MNRTKTPIALTTEGEGEVVVQDAASYQNMVERLEHAELVASLQRALSEMERGEGTPLSEVRSQLNERYGA